MTSETAVIETPTPDGEGETASVDLGTLRDLLTPVVPDEKASDDATNKDGDAGGNADKNAKPKKFNDLAEALGIELDDLYKLEVSTTDGKSVTIEDMKALQASHDDIAIRELEFEESRVTKEGQLRQAQAEIAEVVAGLPNGTLKPEVLEKLRAKNVARVEVEQTKTMEAIPSWSNVDVREKDMVGMVTHLERFGFPVDYLASVNDHRQIVFIRESFLREQRIKSALEKVRAGAPNPIPATKTPVKAVKKTGRKVGGNPNAKGLEAFFSNV